MEFVDTNVLLYAYDRTAARRHQAAAALVTRLGRARLAAISVQVLQEFYVNAVSKIATPLSPAQARARLQFLSRWAVHSPTPADVVTATTIAQDHHLSFWDAMIVRSAAAMGCDTLWTEDLNDGQTLLGVTVRTPFA